MAIAHNDTAPHGFGALFARLDAFAAEVFERAERSSHHRMGSCFLQPARMRTLGRAVEEATGRPCQ